MEFSIPDKKLKTNVSQYMWSQGLYAKCYCLVQHFCNILCTKLFHPLKWFIFPSPLQRQLLFQNLFYGRLIQFRSSNLNNIYCGNFSSNSGYIGSLWALVGSFDSRVKSPKKKNPQTLIEVREIDKGGSDSLSWQKNSRRHCKSI